MTIPLADPGLLRVCFYSHDSVGFGHVRRNLALAHAISTGVPARLGAAVTGIVVTGEERAATFARPQGFDLLVLPSIAKDGAGYTPRHLSVSLERVVGLRESILTAALAASPPDLLVVDRHAYGVDGELREALSALRRARRRGTAHTHVVLGLRDVLDDPASAGRDWAAQGDVDEIARLFDEIWIYGDPRVHDIVASGEVPRRLAPMARHLGLLASGRPAEPDPAPAGPLPAGPYLLTMVGAGSDGYALTRAAARVRPPAGSRHVVVTGPHMPAAERQAVQDAARAGCTVVESVPDGQAMIRGAAAVVSMGGYNTACEILASATPALMVPRVTPRREQAIRAAALARVGAVDTIDPALLTPAALESWFATARERRPDMVAARARLDRRGLDAVADRVSSLFAPHGGVRTEARSVLNASL